MNRHFEKVNRIVGELNLPGDKSISHRSLIFSAMAEGESIIRNLSNGADVRSTMECLKQIGITILYNNNLTVVDGRGFKGFNKPSKQLDAGNSGTTARLLSGLLSPQEFSSEIIGDESLSRRPMNRIIDPLQLMGADISASVSGTLPLRINPVKGLRTLDYKLLIASAQVKSAIILAALHIDSYSTITEYLPTRDHTERMLGLFSEYKDGKNIITVSSKNYPQPAEYFVPADISSAVFFIIAALLLKDSVLSIRNVSLNPSRTAILDILKKMGGSIDIQNIRTFANEPFGDLVITSSELKNIEIPAEVIPNIIDEIPALAIAGIFAEGEFSISGAGELRYKESDRITALCTNLKRTGLLVEEYIDGFKIKGNILNKDLAFSSFGDHRIAMAFAVLSIINESGGIVENFDCVSISNPAFIEQLQNISE
jgi:3-phosphoshikimate 1-carboxyvinyltransferase